MMAIAAAVAFGLALLFDLTDASLGDEITAGTLTTLGLLLVALHLAGVGTGARSWNWRRRR
ncbi:hypothetical protein NONI108955_07775 [Nocardia ninae]|uniref:Uncharacterized protein n=1 Tax=Nocardia ninae NBRC 108245 TaxID=1210091 RepID=A0A511M6D2_9NOCA|nr:MULTISPECIES: hypothetical protein [Nocardia]QBS39217.1 hypothetical protein DMB37_02875 [Nocardia sp. CS682]GEM36190.1 hypothetical protein NN4_07090 [Nocardia ninae NBRC 108245]